MNVVELTMSTLIDRALEEVQSPAEIGKAIVMPSALAVGVSTTTLTGDAQVTDLIEFGSELVMVTAKSTDPDPVYTLQRAYGGTIGSEIDAGTVGYRNPQFSRARAMSGIRRSFTALEAMGVPLVKSVLLTPEVSPFTDNNQLILDPGESVREVLDVRQNLYSVENWEFIDNVPTTELASGNLIRLRWSSAETNEYTVVYRAPYRWSDDPVTEESVIDVPEAAEYLPSSYAAAWLCWGREVSRHDLDRVGEWTEGEPTRAGVSARMVQAAWQKFYRELDEVRRINPVPKRRPWGRRPRARLSGTWY